MWWEGTLRGLAQHGCSEQQGPVSGSLDKGLENVRGFKSQGQLVKVS